MTVVSDLLNQAADRLADPALCNWDRDTAHSLARLFRVHANRYAAEAAAGIEISDSFAGQELIDVARAFLASTGGA